MTWADVRTALSENLQFASLPTDRTMWSARGF